MVFAKHLNPHHNVFAEQIVQVDRDKLYGESTTAESHNGDYTEENESGSRMEGVVGPEGDRLGQLNAILEATFPNDPPTDESAPKKKKKTKKKQKKDLLFRLLPGSPKPISLDDPQHAARPLVRPSEDTEEEALQRARLISVSGVVCDWNDLMKEKAVAWPVIQRLSRVDPFRVTAVASGSTPPSVMVTERRIPASGSVSNSKKTGALRIPDPKPCCPVVVIEKPTIEARIIHQRLRKRKRPLKALLTPRPPPGFFRPEPGLGGKTKGYALGWANSAPLPRQSIPSRSSLRTDSDAPIYARDGMKKGFHVDAGVSVPVHEQTKRPSGRDRK